MSLSVGDLVQIVSQFPEQLAPTEFENITKHFYGIAAGMPHPFYGMIGVIYDLPDNDHISVFFPMPWFEANPNKVPGWQGVFGPNELVSLGPSQIKYPTDKLRLVADAFSASMVEGMNQQLGTSFKTRQEMFDHLAKRSKESD